MGIKLCVLSIKIIVIVVVIKIGVQLFISSFLCFVLPQMVGIMIAIFRDT